MKPTMKVYYKDAYQKTLQTSVHACTPHKDGLFAIELAETQFYPRGGGQPGDKGWLTLGASQNTTCVDDPALKDATIEVVDTISEGDRVLHLTQKPIATDNSTGGEALEITAQVDWQHRYDFMQQHTAQHLLSGLLHVHGHNTVSVNLSESYISIEVDSPTVGSETIAAIEEKFLRIVAQNLPVTATTFDAKNPELATLRRPPKRSGAIRVVSIGDNISFANLTNLSSIFRSTTYLDRVGCGGVHVKNTGELVMALFLRAEPIRGGTRLFWVTGNRILHRYRQDIRTLNTLGTQFSVPHHEILTAIEQATSRHKQVEQQLQAVQNDLITLQIENRKQNSATMVLVEETGKSKQYIKTLIKQLQEISQGTLVVEHPQQSIGQQSIEQSNIGQCGKECPVQNPSAEAKAKEIGWYLILPKELQTPQDFRQQVLAILQGKGGGSGRLWQGRGQLDKVPELLNFLQGLI